MNRKVLQVKDISDTEVAAVVAMYWDNPDPDRQLAWHVLCERYPEKVVARKLGKMVDVGLLEYGVSLMVPWLTEKGKMLLG